MRLKISGVSGRQPENASDSRTPESARLNFSSLFRLSGFSAPAGLRKFKPIAIAALLLGVLLGAAQAQAASDALSGGIAADRPMTIKHRGPGHGKTASHAPKSHSARGGHKGPRKR